MIDLALIFGGLSSEHAISCVSASNVASNLDPEKYNIRKVGITKEGYWYLTDASREQIADGTWENLGANIPVTLSSNRMVKGLLEIGGEGRVFHIDCVLPMLHGKFGEDGTIQGLCELAGIRFVGPGVCSSAVSIDKSLTKLIVGTTGIRQADCFVALHGDFADDPEQTFNRIEEHFSGKYPLFIKPAREGSSIGVYKVSNRGELEKYLKAAFSFDKKLLVEEAIEGKEVEVAVLGNEDPKASVVGEILAANDFYDFNAKYENAESRTVIPAGISKKASDELRRSALTIYKALECKGLSRVDFFLCPDDTVVFNEINTIPGFTNISMYPQLWNASGIPYSELLDKLIDFSEAE